MKLSPTIYFIIFVLLLHFSNSQTSNVFTKIKSSLQMASKLLGLDKTVSVAQLVSQAFKDESKQEKGENKPTQNLLSGFFKLLGLDAGKLGAIVINGFIFLAQLINTTLKSQKITYAKNFNDELPISWLTNNKHISPLLENAKNKDLPSQVIGYIQEKASTDEIFCLELLICKCAPFIWGMQKTISKPVEKAENINHTGSSSMFLTFPTIEEVAENGDKCEEKYPYCQYLE